MVMVAIIMPSRTSLQLAATDSGDFGRPRSVRALEERFGFFERPAQHEQERQQRAARQERNPPAPLLDLARGQRRRQHQPDHGGEHHGHLLARRLPRDVESLASGGGDFGKIHRNSAQFDARRESLQKPADQHQQRRGQADGNVARQQRDRQRSYGHQRQRDEKTLAAAVMVDISAQYDRSQGTHEESRAEGREREHQRSVLVSAGEKGEGDGGGVVGEDLEIVHFQGVSSRDADHPADLRRADGVGGSQAGLGGHRASVQAYRRGPQRRPP